MGFNWEKPVISGHENTLQAVLWPELDCKEIIMVSGAKPGTP